MQADQKFISSSHVVVRGDRTPYRIRSNREITWFGVMAACFVTGLMLGISGLVMSMLTVCGALASTRPRSLAATAMIVASLGSLAFGAHAMDRMDLAAREGAEISLEDEI